MNLHSHISFDPDRRVVLTSRQICRRLSIFFARRRSNLLQEVRRAYARAVLESLAFKYRSVIGCLETVTGKRIEQIRIIGGGSRNRLLNQFTADATGRRVLAGPVEATSLGNIAVQILATGAASSLAEVRAMVDRSFPTEVFDARETHQWDREAIRFQHYTEMIYA